MKSMRILLVEDDKNLGHATAEGLREHYAVDWVRSSEEAGDALSTTAYGLIALDINLPGASGIEFLKALRLKKNDIPVIALTARDALHQKIEGLNAGADDYLVKPFDLDELLARCAALIRRSTGHVETKIECGDLSYEASSGLLEHNGKTISLSARERAVFDILIRNAGRPISKEKITESIYDWGSEEIESNTIEVYVAALRKKIGKEYIKTIRNVGYIMEK